MFTKVKSRLQQARAIRFSYIIHRHQIQKVWDKVQKMRGILHVPKNPYRTWKSDKNDEFISTNKIGMTPLTVTGMRKLHFDWYFQNMTGQNSICHHSQHAPAVSTKVAQGEPSQPCVKLRWLSGILTVVARIWLSLNFQMLVVGIFGAPKTHPKVVRPYKPSPKSSPAAPFDRIWKHSGRILPLCSLRLISPGEQTPRSWEEHSVKSLWNSSRQYSAPQKNPQFSFCLFGLVWLPNQELFLSTWKTQRIPPTETNIWEVHRIYLSSTFTNNYVQF